MDIPISGADAWLTLNNRPLSFQDDNENLDAQAHEDEQATLAAARLFTEYLRACRDERFAMSLLPPGRFLMPGNLAGSPALTFAPLEVPAGGAPPRGSLWAMMERRYEAYKDAVVLNDLWATGGAPWKLWN